MNANNPATRDSRVESFRIALMWGIVSYHLLIHGLPGALGIPACSAVINLLHAAVPCFVLLSGWYGIRPSVRGFVRLWFLVLFYGILELAVYVFGFGSTIDWKNALRFVLPLYGSRWWFFTAYLSLYLVSPVLNAFVKASRPQQIWGGALALFLIAFWFKLGTVGAALSKQNSLALFSGLYLLGNRLRFLQSDSIRREMPFRRPAGLLAVAAIGSIVFGWMAPTSELFARINGVLFFQYNSPGLILLASAVVLSVLAAPRTWHSGIVNRLAASVFAVYVLHEGNPALSPRLYEWFGSIAEGRHPIAAVGLAMIGGVSVLAVGLSVDLLLRPVRETASAIIAKAVELGVKRISACGR